MEVGKINSYRQYHVYINETAFMKEKNKKDIITINVNVTRPPNCLTASGNVCLNLFK